MSFDFDALDHENFMREALKEAELAGQAGERPIGAVIVHQGQVIGRGRAQHRARHSGIAHAEMNALLQAEQYIYAHIHDGCVIYTTVEPCVMCLGAIVMSDIDHIVYALADNWIKPSPMLEMEHVRRHIRHYVGGILVNESVKLWEHFNPRELELIQEGRLAKM
ncbi:MAG TPA: nucleoside deaminase [Anaerolineales bacterium]